jgi:hypothetical protein
VVRHEHNRVHNEYWYEGGCHWQDESRTATTPNVQLVHYSVAEHLSKNGEQVCKALGLDGQPVFKGHYLLLNASFQFMTFADFDVDWNTFSRKFYTRAADQTDGAPSKRKTEQLGRLRTMSVYHDERNWLSVPGIYGPLLATAFSYDSSRSS